MIMYNYFRNVSNAVNKERLILECYKKKVNSFQLNTALSLTTVIFNLTIIELQGIKCKCEGLRFPSKRLAH